MYPRIAVNLHNKFVLPKHFPLRFLCFNNTKILTPNVRQTKALGFKTTMKNILFLLVFSLFSSFVMGGNEAFPAPNELFIDLRETPEKWQGVEVAFEGVIIEFTESGKNTPYFKIRMPEPVNGEVWAALLFSPGKGSKVKVGNIVRVLGYYGPFDQGVKSVGSNNTGYHLLTFCLVNISTKETYFMPQGMNQCEAWQAGELPKT